MIRLENRSVRQKLFLLLSIPLIAALWFGGATALSRQEVAEEMAHLQRLTRLAVVAGDLIHELQLERGMTVAFMGSGGQDFKQELPQQRAAVDGALAAYRAQARGGEVLPGETEMHLARIEGSLGRLPERRGAAEKRSVPPGEIMEHYGESIEQLLALVAAVGKQATNAEITTRALAYLDLMRAKEVAGIRRASLRVALRAGAWAPGSYGRFAGLLAQGEAHLEGFEAKASEAGKKARGERMAGELIDEAKRIEAAALASDGGRLAGLDPDRWFTAQTARIEAMRGVERELTAELTQVVSELRAKAERQLAFSLVGVIFAAVACLLAGWRVARSIVGPLGESVRVAEQIAEGRLDVEIEARGTDEFAQLAVAMSTMRERLDDILSQIAREAREVSGASEEIAKSGTDLSSRTAEQAASLEETASAMEEMAATTRQSAENAELGRRLGEDARRAAESGQEVIRGATEAMQSIHQQSKRIVEIIDVINGIAFQTNLLALNASVEAARAGEQGRGFAVVAGEVRALAQRCAESSKDIRRIVDESARSVEAGSDWVNRSGERLVEIVGSVGRLNDLMTEIAAAARQQAEGIEQVNAAITTLDSTTQQNAALVEESASASQTLQDKAANTAELLSFFKLQQAEVGRPPRTVTAGARPRRREDAPRPRDDGGTPGASVAFAQRNGKAESFAEF